MAPVPAELAAVRGRFAPSPTGELHVGNARTALLAWLHVRSCGGRFILRMEDLDAPRVVPGAAAVQMAQLRALGLDWDEGPDVGGPLGPYQQSSRVDRYERALARLDHLGLTYPCYCSRAEINRVASAPHGPMDDGPRYPGTCRELTPDQRAQRESRGRKPSIRFRVPTGCIRFVDGVQGPMEQDVQAAVGDFVIRRSDGTFAYQLAVVVDDAEMRVTHVVRGADLVHSTPRQILLYEALGFQAPSFAHVPLLLSSDGQRLAKRNPSELLRTALEGDKGQGRLLAALARSAGLPGGCDLKDLVASFDLAALARQPGRWVIPTT